MGDARQPAGLRATRPRRLPPVHAVGQRDAAQPKLPAEQRPLPSWPRLPDLRAPGVRHVQRRVRPVRQRLVQDSRTEAQAGQRHDDDDDDDRQRGGGRGGLGIGAGGGHDARGQEVQGQGAHTLRLRGVHHGEI